MTIIYTNQKSKKRKLTAKQRQLQADWDALVKKYEPTKKIKSSVSVKAYTSPKPYVRETPHYPSLDTGGGACTKPIQGKVYTGSSMIGIGTLHKSNAVPIFNQEDAKEQARMRRG